MKILAILIVMLCSTINPAMASGKSSLFIFGDSLSDSGNVSLQTKASGSPIAIPPETRYYQGRFSNGQNAADMVWQTIGNGSHVQPVLSLLPNLKRLDMKKIQAISFAFGGSETGFYNSVLGQFNVPGLLGQVGMFGVLKSNTQASNAIAMVWSGGNDYLNQFIKAQPASPDQIVGNISNAVRTLYLVGIRSFVIPNLPDLGEVPIAHIMAGLYSDTIPGVLSAQTVEHNTKLSSAIQQLKKLPNIKIRQVDIYSLVKTLITNPTVVMPGPASGCLYNQPAPKAEVCGFVPFESGNNLVFWDETHPTTYVHALFADLINAALQ